MLVHVRIILCSDSIQLEKQKAENQCFSLLFPYNIHVDPIKGNES